MESLLLFCRAPHPLQYAGTEERRTRQRDQWEVLLPPGPASMLTMEAEVVAYSFNIR